MTSVAKIKKFRISKIADRVAKIKRSKDPGSQRVGLQRSKDLTFCKAQKMLTMAKIRGPGWAATLPKIPDGGWDLCEPLQSIFR
jgi:hypothetical protein